MAEKKITINEIAKRAGTSKTTVSFYLNNKTDKMSEETKERIRQVIEDTGYQPSVAARSLTAKRTNLIGVIIGDITNSFANQLVKGIEDMAKQHQYQIIVGNSNYQAENEVSYVDRMLAMGVDGFIIQPTGEFEEIGRRLDSLKKEVVFVDSRVGVATGKWVKTNNYEATYETTLQCVERGYDNFLMLTADPTVISTRKERASGYMDALQVSKMQCKVQIIPEEIEAEEIRKYIEENLVLSKRNLIFIPNCWALPKVFLALKPYTNLIPHTIGILGFDNTEWTSLSSPSITTIVQPAYEEGCQATQMLLDSLEENGKLAPTHTLACTVQWNESI